MVYKSATRDTISEDNKLHLRLSRDEFRLIMRIRQICRQVDDKIIIVRPGVELSWREAHRIEFNLTIAE